MLFDWCDCFNGISLTVDWMLWGSILRSSFFGPYGNREKHQPFWTATSTSEITKVSTVCKVVYVCICTNEMHKWTLYAFLRQVSARLREALPLKRSRAGGKDTFSQAVPCRDMSTLSMTAAVWPWQCWTAVFESECQVVVKPNMSEWSLQIITNRT